MIVHELEFHVFGNCIRTSLRVDCALDNFVEYFVSAIALYICAITGLAIVLSIITL